MTFQNRAQVVFFAYPAQPERIAHEIEAAASFGSPGSRLEIRTWRQLDIAGNLISAQVLSAIDAADIVAADITAPNFNVTYEVGYAIGRGKRCLLFVNSTLDIDRSIFNKVGIYDTLGHLTYASAQQLLAHIRKYQDTSQIQRDFPKVREAPVYVMLPPLRDEWSTRIVLRLKMARLKCRSFDPQEEPRLSAFDAVENVAKSYGVVIPLVEDDVRHAQIHNLRCAFVAGIADGLRVKKLLIQRGESPVPLDFRDFCQSAGGTNSLDAAIHDFAATVTASLQEAEPSPIPKPGTFLQRLDLGASSAENEIQKLASYYLDNDAYRRVSRGEVRLVVGRKGSGKSAIFFRVRDEKLRSKKNVVLDLKPEGYKLMKFKDMVLSLLQKGSAEHLVMAFWEYLLLLELAGRILESDREAHMRDSALFEPYRALEDSFDGADYFCEGDFSDRMATLINSLSDEFQKRYPGGEEVALSTPQVTDLVFSVNIRSLSTLVGEYLSRKGEVWILFDNIDKGWCTAGVDSYDLLILRCLLDATRKLERQLQKRQVEARTVVFLRNDVYELLLAETSDRGKESKVSSDWLDKALLEELIRKRIVFNGGDASADFHALWRAICVSHVGGEETAEFLIDRSLMRPRFLLDLIGYCRGHAVSLSHEKIQEQDILKGLEAFSNDLVTGISLEMRDVFPEAEDVLYAFIGSQRTLAGSDAALLLSQFGVPEDRHTELLWMLVWFGVLGLVEPSGEFCFIHSVHYNVARMKAKIRKLGNTGVRYAINPAFLPALGSE